MPKSSPTEGESGQGAPSPRATYPLTEREVKAAFAARDQYRPILTLEQAAQLVHLAPSTLKRQIS